MNRVVAFGSYVGLLCLLAMPAAADDLVYLKGGRRVRGSVRSEGPTEVVITTAEGATRRLSVDQVERIQYDGPTGAVLAQAWFKERAGNYEDAVQSYERALRQAPEGSFVRIAAEFARARALAKWAQVDPAKATDAEGALKQFIAQHRNTRHYYPALNWLYRVQLALGKTDVAQQTLAELEQSPVAGFQVEAALARAELLMRGGNVDEAAAILADLSGKENLSDELKLRIRLLMAEVKAARGEVEEAVKELRVVIDSAPPENETVNARAFLTLGRVYERADKVMDAILAYLYVDLMLPEAAQYRAEALARLSDLWARAGRPDRARQARELLLQEYPNSQWARQLASSTQDQE